ncbi:hypothetical protein GCM10011400_34530 [Paraburkholderia caffeinilytica]|uniref:Uncharacterized protein n=1 Tax=Paraburkholderia caffeinilytica TaxID=1761016 RepID=A0ABQ1MTF9_9BURK|nr:hypothetical protein GCM10011400_34530 [Paraburkholderia caffeinilytica]
MSGQHQRGRKTDSETDQHAWSIAENLWKIVCEHEIKGEGPFVSRILLALRAPFVEWENHWL